MADLIQDVRDLTQATDSLWTAGTVTYFSDEHIQRALDRYRTDVYREELAFQIDYVASGTIQYFEYQSRHDNFEQTAGGTAFFFIETGPGENVGTAEWTADYRRGHLTFHGDRGGTTYYLTARSYDLYAAGADILDQWASHVKLNVDIATPERSAKMSQTYTFLTSEAKRLRAMARVGSGASSARLVRGDMR